MHQFHQIVAIFACHYDNITDASAPTLTRSMASASSSRSTEDPREEEDDKDEDDELT